MISRMFKRILIKLGNGLELEISITKATRLRNVS